MFPLFYVGLDYMQSCFRPFIYQATYCQCVIWIWFYILLLIKKHFHIIPLLVSKATWSMWYLNTDAQLLSENKY